MNADGHKAKANEIKSSLEEFLPDEEGKHVVAIVELSYGILQHLIAYGMEQKYGRHLNSHVGLCKELRNLGEDPIAQIFESIDTLRAGRWYGGKGNGQVVEGKKGTVKKDTCHTNAPIFHGPSYTAYFAHC